MCELLNDLFDYRDVHNLIKCAEQEDKCFHHLICLIYESLEQHGSEKVLKFFAKCKQPFENLFTITLPKNLLMCISGKSEFDFYDCAEKLISIFESFVNESLKADFALQQWSRMLHGHEAIFWALSYCEAIIKNRSKLQFCQSNADKAIASLKTKFVSYRHDGIKLQSSEGKEEFRSLSVVPTVTDLFQETPGLRCRIIFGDYNSIEDYLDLNFRLIREDMLYGLRKGMSEYKERLRKEKKKIFTDLEHVHAYHSKLKNPSYYGSNGKIYEFEVKMVQNVDFETTKRLKPGNILCLSKNGFQTVIFISILKRDPIKGEGNVCTITTKIELENEEPIETINMKQAYIIIEPHNYFESYRHVLTLMKTLHKDNFPFGSYLVKPCSELSSNFQISSFEKRNLNEENINEFIHSENLEMSQKEAMQLALKSPVSLIQGPPGTGKTYTGLKIIKFLLSHQVRPILVICYTNHTLDKFLEGILQFNKRLIRVGSQSDSVMLKPYVISNIQQAMGRYMYDGNKVRNRSKNQAVAPEFKKARSVAMDLMPNGFPFSKCGILRHILRLNIEAINEKLKLQHTAEENIFHREALDSMFSETFKSTLMAETNSSDIVFCVREWLNMTEQNDEKFRCEIKDLTDIVSNEGNRYSGLVSSDTTYGKSNDPWKLPLPARKRWFCLYRSRFFKKLEEKVKFLEEFFVVIGKHMHSEEINYKCEILKNADVIGLTTTGAAKNRELLDQLKPEIVLVEEAAEVDELHVIASIPSTVKHLILIGDHKQLKPMSACEHLSKDFNLSVSLFERLYFNRVPRVILETQRRMRPSICELLVPIFYKSLDNHDVVKMYEDIRGMESNMFFVSHEKPEVERDVEKTHWNLHEAKFIAALVYYLVKQQNYRCSQITVLTMYSGQQKMMSRLFELKELSDVLVSTVDGFQGEENHIVIVSFVRSNDQDEIGFLKSSNRVCVALSRAMGGLYCIGNFELYAKKDNLWFNLVEKLKTKNELGQKLPVKSKNGKTLDISSACDFISACSSKESINFYHSLESVTMEDLMEDK